MESSTEMRGVFHDRAFIKKLFSLVLPIAFQQLMLAAVSASDAIILGFISQDEMAAVSLATQITFVENLFLSAMTIGLSLLAAQYWGKKDIYSVERIFSYVAKCTVAGCSLFFLISLCFPTFLMRIFTNEQVLVQGGAQYLHIVSPAYLLTGVSQVYLCLLKNTDDAKSAGVISAVCMTMDMLMNVVFIFGLFGLPKMGIVGAALSTTVARLFETIWCVWKATKRRGATIRWRYIFQIDNEGQKTFWRYTAPVLGNELVWGLGFASYTVIMGHLGGDAVAANSIANIVKNLVACFCLGLGSGGGILLGNELGAGNLERAKEYGGKLCKISIMGGILSGVVLLGITPLVLQITRLTLRAQEYLRYMLIVCSYYMIGKSINSTTIAGIFCAGGDSKFGLLCDIVVMWGIVIPLGVFAAFLLKLPVAIVYFLLSLDEFLKIPAVYRHYKKYKWVKNLTAKGENYE